MELEKEPNETKKKKIKQSLITFFPLFIFQCVKKKESRLGRCGESRCMIGFKAATWGLVSFGAKRNEHYTDGAWVP